MKKAISGLADKSAGIMRSMVEGSYSPGRSSFRAAIASGIGKMAGRKSSQPDMGALGGIGRRFVTKATRVPYGNNF